MSTSSSPPISPHGVHSAVEAALRDLPLKTLEPSLLYVTALAEGAAAGADVARLRAAMELAAYLHRDDTRSTRRNLPVDTYVTHPFRLVVRLIRYGCGDTDVLCAAALHDTVEDHPDELVALLGGELDADNGGAQAAALDILRQAFGDAVARIVAAVTNPPGLAGGTEAERHAAYRRHVAEAIADPQVFLVKLADFVDNAGSVQYLTDDDRRARLARKYAPLAPVFTAALDTHRATLPLGTHGVARIEDHLTGLALTP